MSPSSKFAVRPEPTPVVVLELRRIAVCYDCGALPAVRSGEMPFCRLVTEWMTQLIYLTSLSQVRIHPHLPVTALVEQVLRRLLPERGAFSERLRPYVESSVHQVIREGVVMDYRMARRPPTQAELDVYCRRHRPQAFRASCAARLRDIAFFRRPSGTHRRLTT